MIVVGSCYFLLTLLIPYDPNIDFVFPLKNARDHFAAEDMKETIRAIFVYSCDFFSNFESNRIAGKCSNIQNVEYELNIHPFLSAKSNRTFRKPLIRAQNKL